MRGLQELMSSSELSLHFGHYIAGYELDRISYFHALKLTLVLKGGVILEHVHEVYPSC